MFGLETIYFQLILLGVFAVATVVGYKLISNVPTLLHTPLMSGMNALSGVTVLGALTAAALIFNNGTPAGIAVSAILGSIAIALAMVNVVGGFMVTDRMLGMIAKNKAKGQTVIYIVAIVITCGLIATAATMGLMGANGQWAYLALAIVLSLGVLTGIALMGKVQYSKIGNRVSALCMLVAIILTILYNGIGPVWTIYIGLAIGAGMYLEGIFVTLLVIFSQLIMHKLTLGRDSVETISVNATVKDPDLFRTSFEAKMAEKGAKITYVSIAKSPNQTTSYKINLVLSRKQNLSDIVLDTESDQNIVMFSASPAGVN